MWSIESEPEKFEESWKSVLDEFGLSDHDWLNTMFRMRELWISAYFGDLFMGGLVRTTSRSESENSFINNFTHTHLSLVEFWMRYSNAFESQRHTQRKYDLDCKTIIPDLVTPLEIEEHAASLYTLQAFYDFQGELYAACFKCNLSKVEYIGDLEVATIRVTNCQRTYFG